MYDARQRNKNMVYIHIPSPCVTCKRNRNVKSGPMKIQLTIKSRSCRTPSCSYNYSTSYWAYWKVATSCRITAKHLLNLEPPWTKTENGQKGNLKSKWGLRTEGTTVVRRANNKWPETVSQKNREKGATMIKEVSSSWWCDKWLLSSHLQLLTALKPQQRQRHGGKKKQT